MRVSTLLSAAVLGATLSSAKMQKHVVRSSHADTAVAHANEPRTLTLICDIVGLILGEGLCGTNALAGKKCTSSFVCDKTGNDGYKYDHNGNSCPSTYPSDWLYFGTSYGWLPPYGWNVPSNSWVPPSDFSSRCSLSIWWSPPSTWSCSSWSPITWPNWWPSKPTTTTAKTTSTSTTTSSSPSATPNPNWPSSDFVCDGTGNDGWSYDPEGNTLPWDIPYSNGNWLWFGSSCGGWLPEESWNVPSADYELPADCADTVDLYDNATWWVPRCDWILPAGWWPAPFWITLDPTCTNDWGYGQTSTTQVTSTAKSTTTSKTSTKTTTSASPTPTSNNWPSQDWVCDYTGNDGSVYDYQGNTLPWDIPYSNGNWLWFGETCGGWLPEESWNVPSADYQLPSDAENTVDLYDNAEWWSPRCDWVLPSGWWPAPFWITLNPSCTDDWGFATTSSSAPSSTTSVKPTTTSTTTTTTVKPTTTTTTTTTVKPTTTTTTTTTTSKTTTASPSPTSNPNWPGQSWQCGGKGNDGWKYDWQGNSCPSTYPSGFLWFGTQYGWLPPLGWGVPSTTWSPYSGFQSDCGKATWWAPSRTWQYPSTFVIPSFWVSLGWTSYLWPVTGWNGAGTGKDGWSFDYNGNSCPSTYPSGFLYFGSNYGWLQPYGWTIPSATWVPTSVFQTACNKATWWYAPRTWQYPTSFQIPSFWVGLGFSSYLWPLSSFVASGSGLDGWKYDAVGNTCPSSYPSNWLYFGAAKQWHPPSGWTMPSNTWSPPAAWNPSQCTWWKPTAVWKPASLPSGFSCPSWWPTNLLQGIFCGLLGGLLGGLFC